MNNLEFANPEFFYLLILVPLIISWYIWNRKKYNSSMLLSSTEAFKSGIKTLKMRLIHLPIVLRLLAISLLIIVLARPQSSSSSKTVKTLGIDIVICLDISGSMLAEDFEPNRLEAAKKTAFEFIDSRINDRIGLVVFSGKSFTQCPITIDHDILKNLFKGIKSGMIEDGTAIGMGLATAVDRLKDSKAPSKVVVLLTDGMNNAGIVSPLTSSDIAKAFNVRVYTIAVGKFGKAKYPQQTPFGKQYIYVENEIDEPLLKSIASQTGGQFFRATSNKALTNIYREIDKMEKTKLDESIFSSRTEKFFPFAVASAFIFLLEILLKYLYFRKIP